mgnify:CR=1 FL=1
MEHGDYKKKIDFKAFAVKKFTPHLFNHTFNAYAGCGANTISLLTGVSPFKFMKDHWPDDELLRVLRKHKFEIAKLTHCNVTNRVVSGHPIGDEHVILCSIMMIKGEATWCVIYGGNIYHNMEISPVTRYEFFNHPIHTAYLVVHPDWKNTNAKVQKESSGGTS